MDLKEVGIYIKLLCHEWITGKLPSDTKSLLKLVQSRDKRDTKSVHKVAKCFYQLDGFLYNERLEQEREKLNDKAEKARNSIAERWKNKIYERNTDVIRTNYHTDTDTESDTEKENIYIRFREHWNSKPNLTKCRSLEKIKSPLNGRLKEYSEQEILEAIDNYSTIIESKEHYFTYLWTFQLFLAQRNALPVFVTEAKPFDNYKIKKAEPKQHPMQPDYGWDDK